jgi:hypothetical protein
VRGGFVDRSAACAEAIMTPVQAAIPRSEPVLIAVPTNPRFCQRTSIRPRVQMSIAIANIHQAIIWSDLQQLQNFNRK